MPYAIESFVNPPVERRNSNDPSIVGLHLCKICKRTELEVSLKTNRPNGQFYYRSICGRCRSKLFPKKPESKERTKEIQKKHYERRKAARAAGENREYYIYWDSKASDKEKGLENDLDQKFIAKQIASGCVYCGEKNLQMTLDRIDNSLGHTKANVLPACIRCNLIRRDMPFEAWRLLVHGLRLAVEHGRFGEWTGAAKFRPPRKNKNVARQELPDEVSCL